jgi:hypothetical protein
VIRVGRHVACSRDKAYGPELKAVVGFAHRFLPMYPGFPVEVGGVEQLHAAFFERKPHTWSWLALRSRKSGQRWCEGHPYGALGPETAWGGLLRYPTSREKRARCGAPGDCGGDRAQKRVCYRQVACSGDKGKSSYFPEGRVGWTELGTVTLRRPQVPPLRSPEFPVETRGFDDLHTALFKESRTRGRC